MVRITEEGGTLSTSRESLSRARWQDALRKIARMYDSGPEITVKDVRS